MKLYLFPCIALLLCFPLYPMDEEQRHEPTAQELRIRYEKRAQRNKKIITTAITLFLIAGMATDIGTTALAPVTGRNAVPWNATRIPECTYTNAQDCSQVINSGICELICQMNKNNYDTRDMHGFRLIGSSDKACFSLQDCPEEAQSRLILGAVSLTTRILTILMPLWLFCAD